MDTPSGFISSPAAEGVAKADLERIGGTSYAHLYKTTKDGNLIVLKCLAPEYRSNPIYERLLQKEYEIGKDLDSPFICKTLGLVTDETLGNCIELQWIDGRSLEEFHDYDKKTARKIALELCDALAYIHHRQIVHRDLKPSNILVTRHGNNVKLIDFGFSDTDHHAVLKEAAGTQAYAAPELKAGEDVDQRADIYSLGMILSILNAGKRHQKVAARCLAADRRTRPASAEDIKALLAPKRTLALAAAAILIIAIATAATILAPQQQKRRDQRASDKIFDQVTEEIIDVSGAPTL